MSTKLLDLEDRVVTDTGTVVFKNDFFLEKARSLQPRDGFISCERSRDILLYNRRAGDAKPHIEIWEDDGQASGPREDTYNWLIPEEYQKLDVRKALQTALIDKNLLDNAYVWRVSQELVEAEKRDMFPFIRCLVYIRDKFRKNNIVWGVGRGSSCACLIFFLLDINRVDPVEYDIPMEEFFKPEKITDSNT